MTRADVLAFVQAEMAVFHTARAAGDGAAAWRALERVHIVSQPYVLLHLASHWAMLSFAVVTRNSGEIAGQLFRLLLVPLGALSGRLPIGNTGRANVSAFAPMPIPDELRAVVDQSQG